MMNLKQAFRYQTYLEWLITEATYPARIDDSALTYTENHLKSNCGSGLEDETVYPNYSGDHIDGDSLIKFFVVAAQEREKLTNAIMTAKQEIYDTYGFYIDTEITANKFRQRGIKAIKRMVKPRDKWVEKKNGLTYRIDNDGRQTQVMYDIEVVYDRAFSYDYAKEVLKEITDEAESYSEKIDVATINTKVNYTPLCDVDTEFSEAVYAFISE